MKYFVIPLILLSIVLSAHAQTIRSKIYPLVSAQADLDQNDLNQIRLIVEEIVNKAAKDSETRMKEYIDIKFENVDERFKGIDQRFSEVGGKINILTAIVCALIGLIGVIIALPAWRTRKDENDLKKQIEFLKHEIEAIKNGQIQTSQD